MKISKTNALSSSGNNSKMSLCRGCALLSRNARVYSHLLRHSRLEDPAAACAFRFFGWPGANRLFCRVRAAGGAAPGGQGGFCGLVERTKAGHVVEVPAARGDSRRPVPIGPRRGTAGAARQRANLEEMDFLQTKPLREAIHARERSLVLPIVCGGSRARVALAIDSCRAARSRGGSNSYRKPGFSLLRRMQRTERKKPRQTASFPALLLYRDGAFDDQRIQRAAAGGPKRLPAGKLRPALGSEGRQGTRGHHAPSR